MPSEDLTGKDYLPTDEDLANFQEWARSKYSELMRSVNPCDENGELDPMMLNEVLTKFAGNFAWVMTLHEIASNELSITQLKFDQWMHKAYRRAERKLREETAGQANRITIASIKAKLASTDKEAWEEKEKQLALSRSRASLLKGFVKVLEKHAGILQTLSSNMRSEMFFAGGVPIGKNNETQPYKERRAATLVRQALKANNYEMSDD